MSTEIQKAGGGALDFRTATDAAGLCKEIVTKKAIKIQGRQYVPVEGWQAIAIAHGCIASARAVERIEGGIKAIGEIRRGSDGMVLSEAEGFVGDDEKMWGKRDEYAKRAMAQTRAISRAARSAFAHVVVMMDAGLETTPAEEVPTGGFPENTFRGDNGGERKPVAMPKKKAATKAKPEKTPAKTAPEKPADKREPEIKAVTGLVQDVVSKDTDRGTRYGVKIAGQVYGTFDSDIASEANEARQSDCDVLVEYTNGGKIREIVRLTIQQPEPAADQEDSTDGVTIDADYVEDDLPM